MKINNRIIVILGVAVCSLLVALAVIAHFFILTTFSDIEQKQAVADMQRVLTRLNDEVEDVAATCRQWAEWDDTNRFVNDLNPGYIRANLEEPSLFRNMKISYVLFYNNSGQLVWSRGYNPDDGTDRVLPPGLIAIVQDSILPEGATEGISGRRGYSLLDGEPVILAGYRITPSDLQGQPGGTLIMVRQLDPGRISEIAQQTDLDITIRPVLAGTGTGGARSADITETRSDAIRVTPVNSSVIEADATITGIENTPTRILVTVQSSRYLYQQVQVSMAYLAGAIILLALILIIVIRWPLKKYIVNPLLSLDTNIRDIGKSGTLSRQVPVGGDDEIVSLGTTLNRMLGEIQRAQQETIESETKFRTLTETSLAGIFVYRQKILYANHAAEVQTGYTRKELFSMDFWEIVHPDFREKLRDLAGTLLQGGEVGTNSEFKIIRKNGEVRWIDSSAALFVFEGE
jgi:PAS domain S-box-containing protein